MSSLSNPIWPSVSSLKLTYEEKHELQAAVNSKVSHLKKLRKDLHPRFVRGELSGQQYLSGRNSINLKISRLHDIKTKLGITQGFGQYAKGKICPLK